VCHVTQFAIHEGLKAADAVASVICLTLPAARMASRTRRARARSPLGEGCREIAVEDEGTEAAEEAAEAEEEAEEPEFM